VSKAKQKIEPPLFASEAEEAAWLDEHRDLLEENFVTAVEMGEARVGSVAERAREALRKRREQE
jgi:hypothetical protein